MYALLYIKGKKVRSTAWAPELVAVQQGAPTIGRGTNGCGYKWVALATGCG
jgi:hypothetical protein